MTPSKSFLRLVEEQNVLAALRDGASYDPATKTLVIDFTSPDFEDVLVRLLFPADSTTEGE